MLAANPQIFNHNLETVRRLTPGVRSRATYDRSLSVLGKVKAWRGQSIYTKSGLMLGLGETEPELLEALADLRRVGCDILTLGQVLCSPLASISRWSNSSRPRNSIATASSPGKWALSMSRAARWCAVPITPMSLRRTRPDVWDGQSRRAFIRLFALFSAASACGRDTRLQNVLAEIRTQSGGEGGLLQVKLSEFPALREAFGSIRLGVSPVGANHMSTGLFSPVIITRNSKGGFYALEAACTHEGCIVPTFDPALGLMQCPCHGSQYHIDGTVQRGPANLPLRSFATRFDGLDTLTVALPDVSFALEAFTAANPGERMRLDFIAFEEIQYEIRFRPTVTADWSGPVRLPSRRTERPTRPL